MRTSSVSGHRKGEHGRHFCVYTVYNNRTDFPVIVDGTAQECANAMGVLVATFYSLISWTENGKIKKWTILKSYLDEDLDEDWED